MHALTRDDTASIWSELTVVADGSWSLFGVGGSAPNDWFGTLAWGNCDSLWIEEPFREHILLTGAMPRCTSSLHWIRNVLEGTQLRCAYSAARSYFQLRGLDEADLLPWLAVVFRPTREGL